jgi:hypothetical protein
VLAVIGEVDGTHCAGVSLQCDRLSLSVKVVWRTTGHVRIDRKHMVGVRELDLRAGNP